MDFIYRRVRKKGTSRASFVLKNLDGAELKYNFKASNNESEYEVLLVGIRMALALNVDHLIIHGIHKLSKGTSLACLKQKKIT